MPQEITHL
ncbi:hypothetical protein PENNAL_c0856G01361 [Penicillium nalgiovense]|uniref:Uncharacterized protein n=1 Tax=Penicillium nalgiovense TaxID=60175 RepID=A0A1V6U6Q2_PENNA|nr:hypothetical protein PENNAL_c0856G01361 [Penicillium nalgiovense]